MLGDQTSQQRYDSSFEFLEGHKARVVKAHDPLTVGDHQGRRGRDTEVAEIALLHRLRHPLRQGVLLLPRAFHVGQLFSFGNFALKGFREPKEFRRSNEDKTLITELTFVRF